MYIHSGNKIFIQQIRRDNPNMAIPDGADLSDLGYYRIEPVSPPIPDAGYCVSRGEPEEYEPGKWRETWVIESASVVDAKAGKYQERLEALINARNAGFIYNGKLVDSDQESRMMISGAVQLATLALMQGTPEALAQFAASLGAGWRYSDGSVAATDAAGMIAIGQALAARIAYCDAVSQAHKAAIEACTTAAEINALDVTVGYEL